MVICFEGQLPIYHINTISKFLVQGSTQITAVDDQGRNYVATVVRLVFSGLYHSTTVLFSFRNQATYGTSPRVFRIRSKQLVRTRADLNSFWYVHTIVAACHLY